MLCSTVDERLTQQSLTLLFLIGSATLIATDVAARGIDVPDVDYVVHYQVPRDLKT